MAATLAILALLAAGLAWRNSPAANPLPGGSASGPIATPTNGPSQSVAVIPSATATAAPLVTPVPTWSGEPASLGYVGRVSPLVDWAVTRNPGQLYVTTDGGGTWQDRTPADLAGKFQPAHAGKPTDASGPRNVEFISELDGWFSYDQNLGADSKGNYSYAHFLYRTADGGATWSRFRFDVPGSYELASIDRLDARHAFAMFIGVASMGAQQLWATSDGGNTWSMSASIDGPVAGSPDWPYSFEFTTTLEGWGLGGFGQPSLLHTVDGGRTWAESPLPYNYGSSFGFGLDEYPRESAGRLIVSADVSTTHAPDGSEIGEDFVTWASTDSGAHWTLDSDTPLGDVVKLSDPTWPGTLVFMPRFTATVRFFDTTTRRFTATVDASSVCGTGNGADGSVISDVSAFSATDIWLTCSHAPTAAAAEAVYLYGTTDGGITWRLLTKP
jgi:photosystem II stability/assembly factor-like uncharacterized protein